MSQMRILFAGDSAVGGAANYLLGVLKTITPKVVHVPPGKKLSAKDFKQRFDVMILSDYSKSDTLASIEKKMITQVDDGAGLMMVGGWGSFAGPFGGWKGSHIEKILPVKCRSRDDRFNFPTGAHLSSVSHHPILDGIVFKKSPAICGLNDVLVRKKGKVLINARKIITVGNHLTLDPEHHPLLVVDDAKDRRIAAYTSDFAPHWCGGLVDWGTHHEKLKVASGVQIEVGNTYIKFISNIIRWLGRAR